MISIPSGRGSAFFNTWLLIPPKLPCPASKRAKGEELRRSWGRGGRTHAWLRTWPEGCIMLCSHCINYNGTKPKTISVARKKGNALWWAASCLWHKWYTQDVGQNAVECEKFPIVWFYLYPINVCILFNYIFIICF